MSQFVVWQLPRNPVRYLCYKPEAFFVERIKRLPDYPSAHDTADDLPKPVRGLYEIVSYEGFRLCYQVAATASEAVQTSKTYYGHKSAAYAKFIRVST
jgi:hypothetical protein